MNLKKYQSGICIVAAVALLGAAAFCGYHIYHHYAQVDEQTEAFEEIAEVVENAPAEEEKPDDNPVSEGEDILAKYSDLGVPYIQQNCYILMGDNLIIYGHHIKGQKMFGALEDYKSKSFYEGHKTIQFDTLTEQAEYEIVAVFKTVAYSSEGYRYYDFVDAENEDEFNAYVGKCRKLALYDTGVTSEYGDKLITLSTCEYSAQNGRLVVVAKKVN